jgi:hypothetical protein
MYRAVPTSDRGSIVIGWLAKLVVVLVLFAIVAFDGIAVGSAHLSGSDDANNAASAAASAWWENHHSIQAAYDAAVAAVTNTNEKVLTTGFTVSTDGSVHLLMTRRVSTLVMKHVGFLKKYTVTTITGEAPPFTP